MKKFILISVCLLTSSLIITYGQNNIRKFFNDKTNSNIYYVDIDESKQTLHELLLANDELNYINEKLDTDSINPEEIHELKLIKANVNKKIKELILDLKKYMKKGSKEYYNTNKRSIQSDIEMIKSMSEEEKFYFIILNIQNLKKIEENNYIFVGPEIEFEKIGRKIAISYNLALLIKNYNTKKNVDNSVDNRRKLFGR